MSTPKDELRSGAIGARERHERAVAEIQKVAPVAPPRPEPEEPKAPERPAPQEKFSPEVSVDEPEKSFFKEGVSRQEARAEPKLPAEVGGVPVTPEERRIIKKIKAAGKEHEIDFSDEEALTKLVQKGLGADKAFTNADKYEKEVPTLREEIEELRKYKAAVQYFEEAIDDEAELYRRVSGGKTLDAAFKKHQDHETWLATADKTEVDNWELKKRLARIEKQVELTNKEKQEAIEKVKTLNYETNKRALRNDIMTEMHKVSFAGQLGDPVEEADLDDMIYMKAMREVKMFAKSNPEIDEIPQEVLRKSFEMARKRLAHKNASNTEAAVQQMDAKLKEEAAKKAALASTRNYTKDTDILKEIRKAGGRPTDLFKNLWKK